LGITRSGDFFSSEYVPGAAPVNSEIILKIGEREEDGIRLDTNDMRAMALGLSADQSGTAKTIVDRNGNSVTVHFTAVAEVANDTGAPGIEFALDFGDPGKAKAAIAAINLAADHVSRERARLGAWQNRLEHALQSRLNTSENLQAAGPSSVTRTWAGS
jgi:flagellin